MPRLAYRLMGRLRRITGQHSHVQGSRPARWCHAVAITSRKIAARVERFPPFGPDSCPVCRVHSQLLARICLVQGGRWPCIPPSQD